MARGGTFGVGFVFEGALFAGVLFAIIEVAHGILFLVFFSEEREQPHHHRPFPDTRARRCRKEEEVMGFDVLPPAKAGGFLDVNASACSRYARAGLTNAL